MCVNKCTTSSLLVGWSKNVPFAFLQDPTPTIPLRPQPGKERAPYRSAPPAPAYLALSRTVP